MCAAKCSLIMTSNLDRRYGLLCFLCCWTQLMERYSFVFSSTVFLGTSLVSRVKLTLVWQYISLHCSPDIQNSVFFYLRFPGFAQFSYFKGSIKMEISMAYRWNYIDRERPKYSEKGPVFHYILRTTNVTWHGPL